MGLFNLFGHSHNASAAPACEFRSRLRHVLAALELEVLTGDRDGCMVGVPFLDDRYEVIVICMNGRDVALTVLSRVEFPPRRISSEMAPVVRARTKTTLVGKGLS